MINAVNVGWTKLIIVMLDIKVTIVDKSKFLESYSFKFNSANPLSFIVK